MSIVTGSRKCDGCGKIGVEDDFISLISEKDITVSVTGSKLWRKHKLVYNVLDFCNGKCFDEYILKLSKGEGSNGS